MRIWMLILALALAPLFLRAQDANPQQNFLIIIGTSSSMAPRKEGIAAVVKDLISGRLQGRIREGDSLDIWTFDTRNHIDRFPPIIWDPARQDEIADRAAAFISRAAFGGESRFAPVASDLRALLPHTKLLLVLLFTDDAEPLAGIDINTLNAELARLGAESPEGKTPLLVSIAAVDGKIGRWRIYAGEGTLELPSFSTEPEMQRQPQSSRSIQPQTVQAQPKARPTAPSESEPVQPRIPAAQSTPSVIFDFPPGARLTPDQEPAPLPTPGPKASPEPVQPPIMAQEEKLPKTLEAEPREPSIQSARTNLAASASQPKANNKLKARKNSEPADTNRESVSAGVLTPVPPDSSTNAAVALVTPPEPGRQLAWYAISGGLLLLAVGVALLARRKNKPGQGSLISESLRR